ncbi:MAG: hypothetical protein R2854_08295 [Caldilineaceae bacterium]
MVGANMLGRDESPWRSPGASGDLGGLQRVEFGDKALVIVAHRGERETIQQEVTNLRNQLARLPLDDGQRPRSCAVNVDRQREQVEGPGAYQEPTRAAGKLTAERTLKVLSAAQGQRRDSQQARRCTCVPQLRAAVRPRRQAIPTWRWVCVCWPTPSRPRWRRS